MNVNTQGNFDQISGAWSLIRASSSAGCPRATILTFATISLFYHQCCCLPIKVFLKTLFTKPNSLLSPKDPPSPTIPPPMFIKFQNWERQHKAKEKAGPPQRSAPKEEGKHAAPAQRSEEGSGEEERERRRTTLGRNKTDLGIYIF